MKHPSANIQSDPFLMAGFRQPVPEMAASQERRSREKLGSAALKAAARSWFVVAVIGQLLFAVSVASFYGLTALRGDYHKWTRSMAHHPGDPIGNYAVAMHLVSAVVVMLAGAIQLIPRVRAH